MPLPFARGAGEEDFSLGAREVLLGLGVLGLLTIRLG